MLAYFFCRSAIWGLMDEEHLRQLGANRSVAGIASICFFFPFLCVLVRWTTRRRHEIGYLLINYCWLFSNWVVIVLASTFQSSLLSECQVCFGLLEFYILSTEMAKLGIGYRSASVGGFRIPPASCSDILLSHLILTQLVSSSDSKWQAWMVVSWVRWK